MSSPPIDPESMNPSDRKKYERLREALVTQTPTPPSSRTYQPRFESFDSEPMQDEESYPLLRAIRNSAHEGTYHSIGNDSPNPYRQSSDFTSIRPTLYAEKALSVLLNAVLAYALCCIIGLGVIALKFEGVIGYRVNWWIIFIPFWVGNVILIVAHFSSFQWVKRLRNAADMKISSNEPIFPLLRKVLGIFAISMPLTVLSLWSELAFCSRLHNKRATSLYVCYAPIIFMEVLFIVRYILCRARSIVPGICSSLALMFTLMLAYETNERWISRREDNEAYYSYSIPWIIVLSPLFSVDLIMIICLGIVWWHEMQGYYRLAMWQISASVFYTLALGLMVSGQIILWLEIDWMEDPKVLPSALIFAGLVCASVGLYIVSRRYVDLLMSSKGGAVPVPIKKTSAGWITGDAVVERWILLGDVDLTPSGVHRRDRHTRPRTMSEVETDPNNGYWSRVCSALCCGWKRRDAENSNDFMSGVDPESRMKRNIIKRRGSGSYHDIDIGGEDD